MIISGSRCRPSPTFPSQNSPSGQGTGYSCPSLPFAREIVLPTIRNFEHMQLQRAGQFVHKASFNPTLPVQPKQEYGWVSP